MTGEEMYEAVRDEGVVDDPIKDQWVKLYADLPDAERAQWDRAAHKLVRRERVAARPWFDERKFN